jgi:hypothetical protein
VILTHYISAQILHSADVVFGLFDVQDVPSENLFVIMYL